MSQAWINPANLFGNSPRNTSANAQLHTQRWQHNLEQAHAEILAHMQAVRLSANAPAPSTNLNTNQPQTRPLPVARAPIANGFALPADATTNTPANPVSAPTSASDYARPSTTTNTLLANVPAAALPNYCESGYLAQDLAQVLPQSLAWLERQSKQTWPFKHIHVYVQEQAVTLWIRDRHLATDSRALAALIEQIQQQLVADGKFLQRLVLNGKIVLDRVAHTAAEKPQQVDYAL